MRRWIGRLGVLAILVAAVMILRATIFRPAPVSVDVFAVERGRVENTVVNSRAGTVESRLRAEMSPGIAGLVAAIPVKKGERVKRGQTLLRLDDDEHRANATLAERSVEAARASEREACLASERAERDLQRARGLFDRKLISDQDLDAAETLANTTQAECSAATARARQADAALAVARATLAKTVMKAPFDGVVLEIEADVGEWISPSPPGLTLPTVLDLIAPEALYVSAPIDEADVRELRAGQPARITLDAFRGQEFDARVDYVASFVRTQAQQNRTLTVEAVLLAAELPANFLPGLSADIEVILDARDDVLRVPTYALLEGDRVLVVEGDRLVSRQVSVGLQNWRFAELLDGLNEGERVVTSLDRPEVVEGARVVVEKTIR